MQVHDSNFRHLLEREFGKRCESNPRYSLRAFARSLKLESSRLSKILRGERPVSQKLIVQLGRRLNLSQEEIYNHMGFPGHGTKDRHAERASDRSYVPLVLDNFECIEDWRHYALLELMKVDGFQANEKWLSERLKCSALEVRACVERLKRVGLLEVKAGKWRDSSEGFSTHILSDSQTTYAHQRSQKKILALASQAVDDIPMNRRDQSSMMMATNPEKIAEAKRRITRFRRELCEFLEDTDEKNCVYQLSLALFPLTEPDEGKK